MQVRPTVLPEVLLVEPRIFEDARGYFFESFQADRYAEAGIDRTFVQDNVSRSERNVLRGLHIQHPNGQGKLVSVLSGEVFDVVVDVRRDSERFGQWHGETLSDRNRRQLYIPPGFAHGFCVLSECALFVYKCTAPYSPEDELTIVYDDPDLDIAWPVRDPIVSEKDARGYRLADVPGDRLPTAGAAAVRTVRDR